MIPKLTEAQATTALYATFLAELRTSGFVGQISTDYATRLLAATDNSIYQVLPEAVVFPAHKGDVAAFMKLAAQDHFAAIRYAARGGGTGTNGQSLVGGIVVDVSRHMHRILDVAADHTWARVQPGVVLDQLNAHLAPYGVFFAPNLSPSNRATIGGMVNTDACGKGSRVYGRTSDHILSLEIALSDGNIFVSEPLGPERLAHSVQLGGRAAAGLNCLDGVTREHQELINSGYRPLARFMTGYNLARVRSADIPEQLNPNFLFCGSEGTLGIVTEIVVRLVPLPKYKRLVVMRYRTFDDALASAKLLLASEPSAIETIDDTILSLARQDEIAHRVARFLDEAPSGSLTNERTAAINLVEFSGPIAQDVQARVDALLSSLRQTPAGPGVPFGFTLAETAEESAALWELRKKGVGLLGALRGERKPVPFVEDTVVPPENLAEFVKEFRAILDRHGLRYGMFGHVDVGCLHVRPALDLRDQADERLIRQITDEVAALADRYGGVLWGEHGKGMRSEFNPRYFGEPLYALMRRVKAAFDPRNQLNPGKLAVPEGSSEPLATIDGAPLRGHGDRQLAPAYQERYAITLSCNGNGACFNYDHDAVMCPSARITRDRVHSPKGRAMVMKEWLRQLSRAGYVRTDPTPRPVRPFAALARWWRSRRPENSSDYSHEVYSAMSGCLACKGCATQCPVKVDVPAFRSEFLALYHERYSRPIRDYFVAALEELLPVLSRAPRLANGLTHNLLARAVLRIVGIVDTPKLSSPPLRTLQKRMGIPMATPQAIASLPPEERNRAVVIVPDAFTAFYEAPVALASAELLRALGAHVFIASYQPNGKGLHVKGFLARFRKLAQTQAALLAPLAEAGASLICIDPAVALTFRDEYPHALGPSASVPKVELLQEWLLRHLRQPATPHPLFHPPQGGTPVLLAHCTERALVPTANKQWQAVFAAFGVSLDVRQVGCCGMCGVYGHEVNHLEESRGIWDQSWAPAVAQIEGAGGVPLATGHSCRSQAKRFGQKSLLHPAQWLTDALASQPVAALPEPAREAA